MDAPTRKLTKAEVDLELARLADANKERWFAFFTHLATLGAVIAIFWMLIAGLTSWVTAQPESIKALAEVVKAFNLNALVGYLLAAITTVTTFLERTRRKRLQRKFSRSTAYSSPQEEAT